MIQQRKDFTNDWKFIIYRVPCHTLCDRRNWFGHDYNKNGWITCDSGISQQALLGNWVSFCPSYQICVNKFIYCTIPY